MITFVVGTSFELILYVVHILRITGLLSFINLALSTSVKIWCFAVKSGKKKTGLKQSLLHLVLACNFFPNSNDVCSAVINFILILFLFTSNFVMINNFTIFRLNMFDVYSNFLTKVALILIRCVINA